MLVRRLRLDPGFCQGKKVRNEIHKLAEVCDIRGDVHGRRAREVGEAGVGPFWAGFCRHVRVACSSDDLCVRGRWLQGLPSVLPSCGDPRTKGRSKTSPFVVHMEVRGCSLHTTSASRKHADSKQRRLAAVAPQKGDGISSLGHLQHIAGNRDAVLGRARVAPARADGGNTSPRRHRSESKTSPHSAKGVPPNLRCLRPGHDTDHTV